MSEKARNIAFVLVGVAGLLLRGRYAGAHWEVVHSYGGNISVSFAVYFVLRLAPLRITFEKLAAAALGLAAVELFEATDGFQVMSNTYDPWDYLANAVGVALALLADLAAARWPRRTSGGSR